MATTTSSTTLRKAAVFCRYVVPDRGLSLLFSTGPFDTDPHTLRVVVLRDVRNDYNNLFYNPEEGCCVLQVRSAVIKGGCSEGHEEWLQQPLLQL